METHSKVAALNPLGDLLAASGGGDRQAFHQIYQLAAPRLFGIALRMLRRRELAEEVLQEAFVSIWRKAAQYSPERGEPLAWMSSIVRHRAIDRLRADARAPNEVASLEEVAESRLGDSETGTAVADHAGADLGACLERLKADQRTAILLAYYYGLTHEELAAHLGAPLGTVKSWVRRGLIQLRDCLDQ